MKHLALIFTIALLPLVAQAQEVAPPVHVQELHQAIDQRKAAYDEAKGMADNEQRKEAHKAAREDFWNSMHVIFEEEATIKADVSEEDDTKDEPVADKAREKTKVPERKAVAPTISKPVPKPKVEVTEETQVDQVITVKTEAPPVKAEVETQARVKTMTQAKAEPAPNFLQKAFKALFKIFGE